MTKSRERLGPSQRSILEDIATPGHPARQRALNIAGRYATPRDPAIDAEDIVQESLVTALVARNPSTSVQHFPNVVRQRGIDHLRSTQSVARQANSMERLQRRGVDLESQLPSSEPDPLNAVVEMEEEATQRSRRQQLQTQLPRTLKSAVKAKIISQKEADLIKASQLPGRKQEDIAREFDMTPTAVKVALTRARTKLRRYKPIKRLRAISLED